MANTERSWETRTICAIAMWETMEAMVRRWTMFNDGQRRRVANDIAAALRNGTMTTDLGIVGSVVDWQRYRGD